MIGMPAAIIYVHIIDSEVMAQEIEAEIVFRKTLETNLIDTASPIDTISNMEAYIGTKSNRIRAHLFET